MRAGSVAVLGQLSEAQIGDCFRAGGFAPADVAIYTQVVMRRIAALKRPAGSVALARVLA